VTPLSLGVCLLGAVALYGALSLRSAAQDGWRGLDMSQRDRSHVEANPLRTPGTERVKSSIGGGGHDGRNTTIAPSQTGDTTGGVRSKRVIRPDGVVRQQSVHVHLGDIASMMSPSIS